MTPNDNTNNKRKPPRAEDGGGEKLQKVLARKGKGSRREMDALIGEGKVFVNGKRAQTGARVKDGDDVKIKRGDKPYKRKDGGDKRGGGDWRKDKPRYRADGDGDNRNRDRDRGERNRNRDRGDKKTSSFPRRRESHRGDRHRDGDGSDNRARGRDNRDRDRNRDSRLRGNDGRSGDWRKDKPRRHRADGDNRDRNRDRDRGERNRNRPRRDNDKRGGDWRRDKPRHRADGDGDSRNRDRDRGERNRNRPRRDNDKRGGDWRRDKPRHRADGDSDNRARGRDNRYRDNRRRDDNRHRRPRDSKPPLQKSQGEVQILIYNKPVGTVVSREPLKGVRGKRGARPVFDDLPPIKNARWLSIGRLDVSSEGLLLFTDDGDTANRLAHPRYGAQREYLVRVNGALSEAEQQRMCKGIEDDEEVLRADEVTAHNNKESGRNQWYRVLMSSGKNRAVRRMFMFFGFRVSRLMRVRMGPYELPRDLRPGECVFADAKLLKDEK